MKKLLCFLIVFGCFSISFAQSAFDTAIEDTSNDISTKLITKGKNKIVVLYVTDANKKQTITGKYIADIISVNIVNNPGGFFVFDRENLASIAEANKLINDGFIDVTSAQELGRILAVEAIVIGNYVMLSETIKLTVKALDVSNGFVIAATMKDLPLDANAAALLGINISNNITTSNKFENRGFNSPLKSRENYNDPNTVNKDCETNNTGDYCITNNKNFLIQLLYWKKSVYGSTKKISIEPGQTVCLYNLESGVWEYDYEDLPIIRKSGFNNKYQWEERVEIHGQFLVEKCKSKTFIIK